MPSFADSFWSSDYAAGLGVVFDQLDKGCNENDEVLALVNARMEAEEAYGNRLKEIPTQFGETKKTGGFLRPKTELWTKERLSKRPMRGCFTRWEKRERPI